METGNQPPRRSSKLTAALAAAALGALLVSGHAGAQWQVVDPAHIKTQLAEFAKEAGRWGEQGKQWYKEYQQFMEQYNSFLSTIDNMQSAFGLPQQDFQMLEVDEYVFMIEERCGSPYGSGATGVFGKLTGISMQQDVHQQRWELCARLQVALNKQFNEVVRHLNETAPEMQSELESAGQRFVGSGRTAGDMAAMAARMEKVKGDMVRSNEEFRTRMQSYDAYAKATERAQGSLTRATMRGGAGLIRQVTSTAVMHERLCGHGQCD